ncbi:MAG: hypothetical protein O3B41_01105 [Bacteroidetes bacterium]|nr:hypothetical protein [Bacteroidota bacterium]
MSSHDSNLIEVEPEGLSIPSIFGSMAVSVVVVVVLVISGLTFAKYSFHQASMESTQVTGYPTKHETALLGASKLTSYGKSEGGRYTIPIERAMELEVIDATK